MNLLTRASRIAGRSAPAAVAAAAFALPLGAYTGHAAEAAAHHAPRHTFTVVLASKRLTMTPGSTSRVRITIRRRHMHGRVTFRVLPKLPRGVSARISPSRTAARRATLTVRVAATVRLGHYRLRLRARSGRIRRTVVLTLNVVRRVAASQASSGPAPVFSISGTVANLLEPGAPQPIALVITNPNDQPLSITSFDVAVQSVTAPQSTPALPCTQNDFTVQPYSGSFPLSIPAGATLSLSDLGVPSSQWPQLALVDLPTNQDGCQSASISFTYSAGARLG